MKFLMHSPNFSSNTLEDILGFIQEQLSQILLLDLPCDTEIKSLLFEILVPDLILS